MCGKVTISLRDNFGFQCFNISHADMVFSSVICFCHEKNHFRSSPLEAFLGKDVLKKCSKFTGEHPCRSVISVTLLCNFIEITLRHGFSPVNLLHIFRTPFPWNTSRWLLLIKPHNIFPKLSHFCLTIRYSLFYMLRLLG